MSTPEATGVRQRSNPEIMEDKTPNPSNKNVIREGKKPVVKPPFIDVPMGRFLTYMVLGLLALAAFYAWRFTVWAAQAGGYWALISGNHVAPKVPTPPGSGIDAVAAAASAASAAGHVGSAVSGKASSAAGKDSAVKSKAKGKSTPSSAPGSANANTDIDVQAQIYALAQSLGIKPAELSNAIRPLIDPSVPNPAEAAQKELELLKLQIQAQGGAAVAAAAGGEPAAAQAAAAAQTTEPHAGLLGVLGEALLD